MWLTKQLGKVNQTKMTDGEVAGGDRLTVQGESEFRSPESLFPYGFTSLAARGQRAVMLGGRCAGVTGMPDGDLAEGEVRLFSSGGAEILLRSNGQVVINGQTFAPK